MLNWWLFPLLGQQDPRAGLGVGTSRPGQGSRAASSPHPHPNVPISTHPHISIPTSPSPHDVLWLGNPIQVVTMEEAPSTPVPIPGCMEHKDSWASFHLSLLLLLSIPS